MFKKLILVGFGVTLVAGLLLGSDACSYVRTSATHVKDSVKDNFPVTFEIDRARKMIESLTPEIRDNMHVIAKEEVEVERLRKKIDQLESQLHKSESEIIQMKGDLESNQSYFQYAGRRYSEVEVRTDLANRFARHRTKDATYTSLVKVLSARERGLDAARQKLEQMLATKRQLVVDIENLEARHKMVEVAQTSSDFQFDDSRLSRTKGLITDIQTRIEVAEKLVNSEITFHDEIPMDDVVTDDIVEAVAEYFGQSQLEIVSVAENN